MKNQLAPIFCMILCLTIPLQATLYEVGPGKPYTAIGQVPLESLAAGDIVRIYWQAAPYKEKWVIGASGTATQPVIFEGVANASGVLPVIDGEGAVTRLALDYWNEGRSVIKVGGASIPATAPSYIIIRNLNIQSGRAPYTFSDDAGNPGSYTNNAASIHIETGDHITIENCIIHNSGNGIFAGHGSSDITIQGCHIYDNGIGSSIYEHNTYTETAGILYQYNHFGPLRTGCLGNNLKDRSAGTVIRYNWIESGNRQLDLVETDYSDLRDRPDYDSTFVYGNLLIEHDGDGNAQILHFGGDGGDTPMYRENLYFYHNTVVSTRTGNTTLMRLSTNSQSADCRNNIIYVAIEGSRLAMLDATGQLTLRSNYFKPGWRNTHSTLDPGASITVDVPNIEAAAPGFVNEATQDFHLTEGSVCLLQSSALTGFLARRQPLLQYVQHQTTESRSADDDLGACDFKALKLDLHALLQGFYATTSHAMTTTLQPLLPLTSPYAASPRTIASLPATMTDWLLVSLNTSLGSAPVAQRAFLLLQDGQALDFDQYGSTRTTLLFPGLSENDYYVAVDHRNHVEVASAAPQPLSQSSTLSYDFSATSDRYYGGSAAAKEVEPGVWALWAGDCTRDGLVTTRDYVQWYNALRASSNGYNSGADLTGDATVNLSDYILWRSNAQMGSGKMF